jgi:predicted NAD/FAD-binding protein
MLVEIRRFHRAAHQFLTAPDTGATDLSLGEFARAHRFTEYFRAHFLVPMVSAVWSCAPDTAMEYPARYLFRFLDNHGMLAIRGAPRWRTVVGGSRTYVDRIAKDVHDVRLSTPVSSVRTTERHGHVRTADGDETTFDGVVVATHADQALRILAAPTPEQRRSLGAFGYSRNVTVLHRDTARLPRARRAWASWNYRLPSCSAEFAGAQVSYHMNSLQGLLATREYVVTLNAVEAIDPDQVIATMTYEHPVYTRDAVAVQAGLARLSDNVIAFAGAHHGWGFHEDGCRAGVEAARALGATW